MAQRDDTPAPTSTANESPIAGPRPAQPKRYSTVNISKKFLEKNSATTSPSSSAPSASVPKSICPSLVYFLGHCKIFTIYLLARTPTQTPASQSHSKLVTAKLTAPATSSATQGWSRPASTAAPSSSSPPPNPAPPVTSQKSLHPQQRPPNAHKDPSKPAWGSLKSTSSNTRIPSAADFPTAAEVAQGSFAQACNAHVADHNSQARLIAACPRSNYRTPTSSKLQRRQGYERRKRPPSGVLIWTQMLTIGMT